METLRQILANLRQNRLQQRQQKLNRLDQLNSTDDDNDLERAELLHELEQDKVVNEALREIVQAIRDAMNG